jgi:hypothetical protein
VSKRWIVVFDNSDDVLPLTFAGSSAYLTQDGRWGPGELAAKWSDKKSAEDVAASLVIQNPKSYLGRVRVERSGR